MAGMETDLDARLAGYAGLVDTAIERLFSSNPTYNRLYDILRYHFGWLDRSGHRLEGAPGKKLRPALCLLVADSLGAGANLALPAAVAVELVHNFSLVHDDIEDASRLRRHRETVWAVWGAAQAINAGDALLVLAQRALADAPGLSPEVALGALRRLNEASVGLCEGQYLDLLWEGEASVGVEQYLEMIERKTARLFQCAAELGAYCSDASPDAQRQAAAYGGALGMAFQVVDDLLGVWGPEVETGKSADLDVASRKKTLPVALALAAAPSQRSGLLRDLFGLGRQLTPAETAKATSILEELGTRDATAAYGRRYRAAALASLDHPAVKDRADLLREFTTTALPQV